MYFVKDFAGDTGRHLSEIILILTIIIIIVVCLGCLSLYWIGSALDGLGASVPSWGQIMQIIM